MKKAIVISMIVGFLPGWAAAKGNFPMAGCGLGYIAFGHQENSKLYQILGATVNDIVSPKTSAITSGTSGCTEDGAVKLFAQAEVYTVANFDSLRQEMATGNGDYVNTFASLIGATDSAKPALLKMFQADYAYFFPSANTTPTEMLERVSQRLEQHPELLG